MYYLFDKSHRQRTGNYMLSKCSHSRMLGRVAPARGSGPYKEDGDMVQSERHDIGALRGESFEWDAIHALALTNKVAAPMT